MTSVERDRQRQGPRRGDEALAIPGYRHGFAISFDATRRTVIVGPGIVSIRGELIRHSEASDAKYARFIEPQVASNFFWLYVGPDEPLVVSRQPPVFDSGEFSDVHPEDNRLVALGCLYVGTDGEPLWANAEFHSQPREVWVGASDWVGVADYRCDGTADEIEINMALRFQQEVESSTIIRLSGGSFRCDKPIKGGLENILDGQGARTIIYASPLTGFQNLAAQIRSLRHIDGDTDVVYASWGGGVATTVLYATIENRHHAHVAGELRVQNIPVVLDTP